MIWLALIFMSNASQAAPQPLQVIRPMVFLAETPARFFYSHGELVIPTFNEVGWPQYSLVGSVCEVVFNSSLITKKVVLVRPGIQTELKMLVKNEIIPAGTVLSIEESTAPDSKNSETRFRVSGDPRIQEIHCLDAGIDILALKKIFAGSLAEPLVQTDSLSVAPAAIARGGLLQIFFNRGIGHDARFL